MSLPLKNPLGALLALGALGLAASLNAQSLAEPLARWTLNGDLTSTGTATGLDGSFRGGATYVDAAPPRSGFTQSLDLTKPATPGYSTFVEVDGARTAFSGGFNAITLSMWVNFQADPLHNDRLIAWMSGNNGFDLRLINVSDDAGISANDFRLAFSVNGASGVGRTISSAIISDIGIDNWLFVSVTYDSDTGAVKYLIGTEADGMADRSPSTSFASEAILFANTPLWIGATPLTTADRTPPAFISDVRIYDSVLTSEQLGQVSGLIPEPSSAVALLAVAALGVVVARRRRNRGA